MRQYIIFGSGGHATVVADILLAAGESLKGFLDDSRAVGTEIFGAKVLGGLESHTEHPECLFIIGIGDNRARRRIAEAYPLEYGRAIHPAAVIARQTEIGAGTVIMAGAVINPRTVVGKHCIINTRAGVDHDCRVGDYAHISPGASLAGTCIIGEETQIGVGACVRNNISVCGGVLVGAGGAVVKPITEAGVYVGVPVRRRNN